eukprot:gene27626-7263_t
MAEDDPVAQEGDPLWDRLSAEQILEYRRISSEEGDHASGSFLSEALSLSESNTDARAAAKVDYASFALDFAGAQKLSTLQTAAVFNMAMELLEGCIGGASLQDTQIALKNASVQLLTLRPGRSSSKLSPEQVARLGMFLASSFLRHYKLYSFLFQQEQDVEQHTQDLLLENIAIPKTLNDALSETDWLNSIEERKARKEADGKAAAEAEEEAAAEAERQRLQKEKEDAEARRQWELTMKPSNLEEAIQQMVAFKLEEEKAVMEGEYKAREKAMVKEMNRMQGIPDLEEEEVAAAAAAEKKGGKKK